MSDELLPYYNSELAFIRRQGAEFARSHERTAARLGLGAGGTNDPHVERLIEAFAFMNARIRHKLDDDFPELAQAMLDILYPHYLAPIPSMAIVRFELDAAQGELTSGYVLSRGTRVETEPIDGNPCQFRTCYPVTLWPIRLTAAELKGAPFKAPMIPKSNQSKSVLRLSLRCVSPEVQFSQLNPGKIRFYLNEQPQYVYQLYELIMNNVIDVRVANSENLNDSVQLPLSCLEPVGFQQDEGLLPCSNRSFPGYGLLTEFFVFPEKFLFFDFDLTAISSLDRSKLGGAVDVFLYMNRTAPALEPEVTDETFALGCTPIVNLFPKLAEPIRMTQFESEYHIVPDHRNVRSMEIYSVDRVEATNPYEDAVEFKPFYSFAHASAARSQRTFWHGTRRPADSPSLELDDGTEMYLSLVDLEFTTSAQPDSTLHVETTCLNRDLPGLLPFGGNQPRMNLPEGGPISSVICLTPPTKTRRPSLHKGTLWKLVSHLSLNHLSLAGSSGVGHQDGAVALKEILKLYCSFVDESEAELSRTVIDGIQDVSTRRDVGRSKESPSGGICRGVEVTIRFDERQFTGSGVYLFASVLEKFLGLYCSINSFSRLVAVTSQGVMRRWAPRAGDRKLL